MRIFLKKSVIFNHAFCFLAYFKIQSTAYFLSYLPLLL